MALLYRGPLHVLFTDAQGQGQALELDSVLQEDMPGLYSLGLPPHLTQAQGAQRVCITLPDGRTFAGPVGYQAAQVLTFEVPA